MSLKELMRQEFNAMRVCRLGCYRQRGRALCAPGGARIDPPFKHGAMLSGHLSHSVKRRGPGCAQRQPHLLPAPLVPKQPGSGAIGLYPKNQSAAFKIADIVLPLAGFESADTRGGQPCGHFVDTLVCNAVHDSATSCNVKYSINTEV